ncbi:metallophosphoesterase [Pseudoalteromonas sp. B62]|uniref:metallophosphoesterase n=1 Tax=Pseudoalteromonas sp. B62 TaxID=630483 RepID=UPI00301E338F
MYTKNQQTTINEFFVLKDGPYIAESNSVLDIAWICNDKAKHQATEFKSIPIYFSQCGLTAEVNTLEFTEDIIEFTGVSKIAALSDLHGQFDLMKQLLTNNKIINNEGKWSYGDGHFVITGDIFDRGDKVTEILWFIFELEQQAKQAGGSLHLLLGNHEVMVLNNDLRYLHAKYVRTAKLLDVEFVSLFNKHTILGRWLRSKAVLVKIDDYLFAHGGSPRLC